MSEEQKKGVIIEFDFTALDGAALLYKVAESVLGDIDVPYSPRVEAEYLAGGNCQGGLSEYFSVVKTKKTAAKASKDIFDAFRRALNEAVPKAVTEDFKSFVRTLTAKGLAVVISTRADLEVVQPAFEDILGNDVALYSETSATYGSVKWDAWRRACVAHKLRNSLAIAVTGSGYGVKSALLAGMGSIAVICDHVAYQDFGGADEVVTKLDADAAAKVLKILRVR